ncbi:LysR family transcriptional regulator [Olsenella sp. An188]|uniref:LysR family transcriptional regulator n=1 Tax=Olsenella sp. An188 TaxID=1965579 RepID=UPI000B370754|nr:LysR family transcriptional regulator [Olsenella sp. An188]OUP39534.1 LysR family transcriptional regulator [Olsenella sp. An188]
MELRHLQYFLMVAREGTISGAAAALHVSQPSLSRQMQDLERDLGVRLFERGSRRITLTEPGMRLRGRAEEIVDLVGRAETEFRVTAGTLAGEVRVAGGETPAMGLVADAIAVFKDAYPLVRFNLFSGNAEAVGERLDRGRADFGVFVGHADLSRFEFLQLPARDRWGVFMREDDPLTSLGSVSPDDLAGRSLVLSEQAGREMGTWFHRDLDDLDVVATYNLLYNAALLARRGVGYVISLEGIVDTSTGSGLAFRPLEPAVSADIFIAWKRYQSFSPAAEAFLAEIRRRWGA